MKTTLSAIALAATLAQPASAVTFPKLTTIYVGAGVLDSGAAENEGTATSFHCVNASGLAASIRFLVLSISGAVAGSITLSAAHGATVTASTHGALAFLDTTILPNPTVVRQGGIVIEATQSAIFCTAMVVSAAAQLSEPLQATPLHLVRVNPHPGTVE
jgi:hypothetical protein